MNIELTDKELRRLLDMVYIGNWILNSTRGDDRFEDYDLIQEKLFALCPANGMRSLVQNWQESGKRSIIMPCSSLSYFLAMRSTIRLTSRTVSPVTSASF